MQSQQMIKTLGFNATKLSNSMMTALRSGFSVQLEEVTHYFFSQTSFSYRGLNAKTKTQDSWFVKRVNKTIKPKPTLYFVKYDHSALFTLEELASKITTHDVIVNKSFPTPRYVVERELQRAAEQSYDPYDPNPAIAQLDEELAHDSSYAAVLARSLNQRVHSLNGNIDRANVYFASRNFRSLLNEISMKNSVKFVFSKSRRIPGTPDHEPKFSASLYTQGFPVTPLVSQADTKVAVHEKLSKLWFEEYLKVSDVLQLPSWVSILLTENGYSLAQKRARNSEMHSGNGNILTHTIPRIDISIIKNSDESIIFEFNRKRYEFVPADIKLTDNDLVINFGSRRSYDEFTNQITRQTISNINSTGFLPIKTKSFVNESNKKFSYSNHRNFNPLLRLIIELHSDIRLATDSTEGKIGKIGKVTFAPKNLMRVNFERRWYYGSLVPTSLYSPVMSSLKKQSMTKEQLYLTAAQLSILRMFNLQYKGFNETISLFWRLFNLHIAELNLSRQIPVNLEEAWQFISTQNIKIPTEVCHYGNILEVLSPSNKYNFPDSDEWPTIDFLIKHVEVLKDDLEKLSREEITNLFVAGGLEMQADEIKTPIFDFNREKQAIPNNISLQDYELTNSEEFLSKLVYHHIFDPSIISVLKVVLPSVSNDLFSKIMDRLVKFSFGGFVDERLSNMFSKLTPMEEISDDKSKVIGLVVSQYPAYKNFARRCQLEAQVWSRILNLDFPRQIFNNYSFIKKIASHKLTQAEPTMYDDQPSTSKEQDSERKGWFKRTFPALTQARDMVKESLTNVADGNKLWAENRPKLMAMLEKLDSPYLPKLVECDFSTFSSSLASTKKIVNDLFHTLLATVTKWLGIDYAKYKPDIDVTTFFFYYLIWKDTSNIGIKVMIIVEVLSSLKIIDKFTSYLHKLWLLIKKMGNKVFQNCVKSPAEEAEFEAYIENLAKDTLRSNEVAGDIFRTTDDPEEDICANTSFIETILGYLEKGSPYFLGAAATLLLMSFTTSTPILDPKKYNFMAYGNEIIKSARNLSFLGAGVAAAPKIYTHFVAAFKWVVDQVESIVKKDHFTCYQINKRAEEWITATSTYSGNLASRLVRAPDLCINYLSLYNEMNYLKRNDIKLTGRTAVLFSQRVKQFEPFFETVKTVMHQNFNLEEMIHVQVCGEPGAGKTDLCDSLLRVLKDAYASSTLDFGEAAQGSAIDIMNKFKQAGHGFGDIYNMNETLKHMDAYEGQNFIRIDDCNLFSNPDPEAVTTQILMLSGTATIANKANLNDKGMTIQAKAQVSATNNPFLKPQHMPSYKALWRRRILIHVGVVKEFADSKGNLLREPKLTQQFEKLGLNRTRGDHLRLTVLDPLDETYKALDKVLTNMTVAQTMRYINAKAKNHYAREWRRGFEKDPYAAAIKIKFNTLIKLLENDVDRQPPKTREEFNKQIKLIVDKILENRKTQAEKIVTGSDSLQPARPVPDDKTVKDDLTAFVGSMAKTVYNEEIDQYLAEMEDARLHYLTESTMLKNLTKNEFGNLEVIEDIQEFSFDPHEDAVEDIHYCSKRGRFVCKLSEDDLTKKGQNYINKVVVNLRFLNALSKTSADSFIRKARLVKQVESSPLLEKLKTEAKYRWEITKQISGEASRFIMAKVCDYIGKPLITGMCVTIALFGLFFSCSLIGQALAPTPTMYAPGQKPLKIFGTGTQHTYLEREEIDKHYQNHADGLERQLLVVKIGESRFIANGVQGNIFMINHHCTTLIKKNTKVELLDPITGITVEQYVGPSDFHRINMRLKTDAALINFSAVRTRRTITNRFMSEMDIQNKMSNLRTSSAMPIIYRDDKFIDREFIPLIPITPDLDIIEQERLMAVNLHVNLGESGSLFTHDNTMLSGHILGLLTSRNVLTNQAFIGIISREEIEHTLKKFEVKDKIIVHPLETSLDPEHTAHTIFNYNQVVKKSPYPTQSISKTKGYRQTPFHGIFPVESEPAIQEETDPRWNKTRHFLEVSLNKTSGAHFAKFDIIEEKWMKDFYEAVLLTYIPNLDKVMLYSTQQAIMGVRIPGSTSMDLSTCAGLPYKLSRGVSGKTPYMSKDYRGTWNIQELVFHEVARYESSYCCGIVPQNVKLEFRKKELVGPNKILTPKTRTVGMGNMVHQIIFMKIFKDLHTLIKKVWADGGSMPFALGVNPNSEHWNQIVTHLKYTDYMVDMDVKAWEEKISQRLLFMCDEVELKIIQNSYRFRNEEFPSEVFNIAYGLSADYTQSDVAFEDFIYEKPSGLLSGHPGTFMRNSAVHTMIIGLAARKILLRKNPQLASIPFIIENVRFILAADDVVIAISPQARKYITVSELVKAYNEIGFEVTAADKGAEILPKTIEEVQFLKHHFVPLPQHCIECPVEYKCSPNLSIIYQLVNWYSTESTLNKEQQIASNLNDALNLAWQRGPEEYNRIRDTINMACQRLKMNYVDTLSYEGRRELIYHNMAEERRAFYSSTPQVEDSDLDYVVM
jgi:hypothetical protein